jgi:hypothetical protein
MALLVLNGKVMSDLTPYAIDWRALFNHLNISWKDRGRNTSKGNVNINCPLCHNDDGYHLRISEDYEIYNCWRDKTHGGTSFMGLLWHLGIQRTDAINLLNEFRLSNHFTNSAQSLKPIENKNFEWEQFSPLEPVLYDTHVGKYLISRGFSDPEAVARNYDLRYAPSGRWAQRLLIPLKYDGAVRTWTGRSVQPYIEPKYLVNKIDDPSQLYIPRPPRNTLYVVEGPIDALKICVAFENTDISAVALCSRDLNAARIRRIQAFNCLNVFLMLDNDTPTTQTLQMLGDLAMCLRGCYVARRKLPGAYKDAGEVSEQELRTMLR